MSCFPSIAAGVGFYNCLSLHVQIKELDPDNASASNNVQRLTPVVDERREKMKDEMLGASRPIRSDKAVGLLLSSPIPAHSCPQPFSMRTSVHSRRSLYRICALKASATGCESHRVTDTCTAPHP